ncbi:hypothetical protein [Massilia sp. BSC265]|uniref:hypothetical protein n=1 Tax=Massilia sp. BSC265 TaxID=1549812 RepID=UPI0004E8DF47|nr:hypothetical protein [Massilia sp. BSC265]KFI07385.1 hypothetical protein JN27_10615 [Massilia sp. BSC265]
MDDATRAEILETGWRIHDAVEDSLLRHPATRGGDGWQDKQRLLLADMALHLLQAALAPGDIRLDKLRNSLHAILTVSDGLLPQAGLREASRNLYAAEEAGVAVA